MCDEIAVLVETRVDDAYKRRWLRHAANATLAYPVVFAGLWYGQWFLAWHALGHQPVASVDDPKYIDGASWMHGITELALIGVPFVAIAALCTNIGHIVGNRLTAAQAGLRLQTLVAIWIGMGLLVLTDPYYPIVEWWLD